MPSDHQHIACRACSAVAECTFTDSKTTDLDSIIKVRCSACDIIVEGVDCQTMVYDILRYIAQTAASDAFGRGLQGSTSFRYTPAVINESDWPFTLKSELYSR